MADRDFQSELDLVIEQFDRDRRQTEEVWDGFRALGHHLVEVPASDLTELEEVCRPQPRVLPTPQPFFGAKRC